jgi:hypothetical protein
MPIWEKLLIAWPIVSVAFVLWRVGRAPSYRFRSVPELSGAAKGSLPLRKPGIMS